MVWGRMIEENNMDITKKDLVDQCELIQDDLMCVLDGNGLDDRVLNNVCQVIVDRIKILQEK